MVLPRIGLLTVGFGSLDQAIKLSAGLRAFARITEQLVSSSDSEGRIARSAALLSIGRSALNQSLSTPHACSPQWITWRFCAGCQRR